MPTGARARPSLVGTCLLGLALILSACHPGDERNGDRASSSHQLAGNAAPRESTGSPSVASSPSPTPSSSSTRSQRDKSELYVRGVTVYICRPCLQVAREAHVDLPTVLAHAVRRVASMLPLRTGSVTVRVKLGRIDVGHHVDVLGLTHADDTLVAIPRDPDELHALRTWVPIVAHELHHTVRNTVGPGSTGSLLDRLVSEGTAVAFEEEAFPRYATDYWDHVLLPAQEAELWQAMRPHLHDSLIYKPRLVGLWFLGADGVPDGTGYVIGYHIVKDYLARHSHASAASLATVDSDAILSGSGYAG